MLPLISMSIFMPVSALCPVADKSRSQIMGSLQFCFQTIKFWLFKALWISVFFCQYVYEKSSEILITILLKLIIKLERMTMLTIVSFSVHEIGISLHFLDSTWISLHHTLCFLKQILILFLNFYWSIIALQWCASFCFIQSESVIHISISPYLFPVVSPSLASSLSHSSRWSQSTELISLCYATASH